MADTKQFAINPVIDRHIISWFFQMPYWFRRL
jgi:hypothetical protein